MFGARFVFRLWQHLQRGYPASKTFYLNQLLAIFHALMHLQSSMVVATSFANPHKNPRAAWPCQFTHPQLTRTGVYP